MCVFFAGSNVPIQHFSPALFPKGECDSDHLFLARSLFPSALFAIRLDLLSLLLNGHPNAIKLHDWRGGRNALPSHLLDEGFDLVDALIECPKPNVPFALSAPALYDRT
jgi:hypothetical protein